MSIPIILIAETDSFKKIADPKVVNKKTIVANIGYALERSLKLSTLSHITNDNPYNTRPPKIYGLMAAFDSSISNFAFSPLIPPIDLTPVFKRMLAVTLSVTLTNKRVIKLMLFG